ncbi:MAG: transporter substrate-binding domain-containing protein [Candidatus Hydrogenedentes bacterium]|nr:transporter substrate-binding domain-containing protein [Candidatus Hydrogenedentota bacterium]
MFPGAATRIRLLQRAAPIIGAAALLFLHPAAAQGQQTEPPPATTLPLSPDERNWIADHPIARVAATPDWPPFEFIDGDGAYRGISADLLRTIADRAGLQIEPVPGKWVDLYRMLQNKELDLSPAMQRSPEREQHFLFTGPVLNFPHAIYTHRDRKDLARLEDLAGKQVAVEQDYYEHEFLGEHHPEIRLVPVENSLQALLKVANGEADAYVGNVAVSSYLIDKNVLSDIRMGSYVEMGPLELSMGVRSDYPVLVSILEKGIASLTPGEKRAIVQRYAVVPEMVALSAAEHAWIREHPVIRLGIDPEFAPFEFVADDGNYQGIAAEYIDWLNAALGLNMRVAHNSSWEEAVREFQAGNLDVLPCVGQSESRKTYLDFSAPYLSYHRVVITRLDTPFMGDLGDLRELRIGAQKNTSHDEFLRENASLSPVYFNSFEETLEAVAQGEVDCAVGNSATTAYWIKRLGLSNLKLAVPVGQTTEALHFGVRKDWPELIQIINKGLESVGEEQAIAFRRKWIDIEVSPGVDIRRVWGGIAALLSVFMFLLLLAALHNRRLRREIDARLLTQIALKESEEGYRTLVESANSVILRMTPEGTIVFLNTFGERFLGYAANEIAGQNLVGTIVPKTESSGRDLAQLMEEICKNPDRYSANENENITKDGRRVWIAWTNRALFDDRGRLAQVLCVGNDVTPYRDAADTLRRYDFIVNTVDEMMSVINASGCYEAVNEEWCAATGITRDQALGRPVASVWSQRAMHDAIAPRLDRCFQGETVTYETVLDLPARGERFCHVTMYPYANQAQHTTHAVVVAQDVTERKRFEAALHEAKLAAEAGNRAKSTFLANMSHEIRTPLNAVIGYAQLLQRMQGLNADQAHALDAIRKSSDHLLTLISDILELSRIEAGRMDLHPSTFHVPQLLADIEQMFRVKTDARGLRLTVETAPDFPQYLVADQKRVSQVLINLIGNAFKFTEHGGITVRAHRDPDLVLDASAHLGIVFEVEDTGCGIAPEQQETIFGSFEQAGPAGLRQGGTGLGLTICRSIATMMGGGISLHSEVGKGSRFRFTLLAGVGEREQIALPPARRHVIRLAPGQPEQRVLVVDDRASNRDLLCRMLNHMGFVTREAADGQEALDLYRAWPPRIVLIDLVMPVMGGREAIRRLRALPGGQDGLTIIALTASTLDEERIEVLADGADEFLRKPFREEDLLEAIRIHAKVDFEWDESVEDLVPEPELTHAQACAAVEALPVPLALQLQSVVTRGAIGEAKALAGQLLVHDAGLAGLLLRRATEYRLNELMSLWAESAAS